MCPSEPDERAAMSRLMWILYLVGASLVLGSYLGLVRRELASAGWAVATGIAFAGWCGWFRARERMGKNAIVKPDAAEQATEAEQAARREVYGDDAPGDAAQ